jgi:hypothetical protein
LSILKKLHESAFKSLALAGLPNWYDIVKANPELESKYLKYLKVKSEYITVSIDYSQLELYVLASLSGDPDMIATVNSGKDLHDVNTEKVYKLCKADLVAALETAQLTNVSELIASAQMALEDFATKRKFIKALSFSLTYGAGVGKIAKDLKITIIEAQKLIDDFYAAYPKVKEWQNRTFLYAIQNGFVDTPFGRQRATPKVYKRLDAYYALVQERKDVVSKLKKAKEYWALREEQKICKNTPVQSTATDMCSKAACKVRKWFIKEKRRATMMFWVHDAIVFSTHIDEAVENIKKVVDIMENDVKYPGDVVNYRTEAEVGYNYEYVAKIKRSDIYSAGFDKELILKKLEESLEIDLKKKFKLVIKATGTSMDTLKQYTDAQREAKGDYFNQLVENLDIGVSTPEEYMAYMNQMSVQEYIDAEETKIDEEDEDDD